MPQKSPTPRPPLGSPDFQAPPSLRPPHDMVAGTKKQMLQENTYWLVVGPPLWKIWKSIGMIIPNICKNKKCSKPPTSLPNNETYLLTMNYRGCPFLVVFLSIPWEDRHQMSTAESITPSATRPLALAPLAPDDVWTTAISQHMIHFRSCLQYPRATDQFFSSFSNSGYRHTHTHIIMFEYMDK